MIVGTLIYCTLPFKRLGSVGFFMFLKEISSSSWLLLFDQKCSKTVIVMYYYSEFSIGLVVFYFIIL